jgi:sugar O-acyltransferase (sialic acid O-acetyltransferase NeuD family)
MRRLVIVGAGGHGRSVAEAVLACGQFKLVGFLDDGFPGLSQVWDLPVLGGISEILSLIDRADVAIVAIGNNQLRKEVCTRLRSVGLELATIIHPRAIVSPSAIVRAGSAIMAGAIVGTEAVLGVGVIVNCGAVVDHHCKVEDFGHLGVNAAMAGGSTLGEGAWMQAGSALGYGVTVDAGLVLAPGEAVGKC